MNTLIPTVLTVLAVIGVIYSFGNIRRGGARVYTLERETILRRATSALAISTLLFLTAVGLLIYQQSQLTELIANPDAAEEAAPANTDTTAEASAPAAVTPQPVATQPGDDFIPGLTTAAPEPTIDPNIPTPTPTIAVVRGFIANTSGFGVNFRANPSPNGELIEILPEDTFVTVIEEEGEVEAAGFTWIKIRTFTGDEGWIVTDFITIEGR